jgi:GMP synthase (glutamine-hydrolysing)
MPRSSVRVLAITHGRWGSVGAGVFAEAVAEAGGELLSWCTPLDPQPPGLDGVDAVMAFGGSMHPDQEELHGWIPAELALLRRALDDGTPVLGVCLGAQLLARAAGARVGPAREAEIGWHAVELTDEGRDDEVVGTLPPRVEGFQWHHYSFEVPPGATELARSPVCAQAFRVDGRAWGIQFHAEVTRAMIDAWLVEDGHEVPGGPEPLAEATAARIEEWNAHGRRLAGAFLEQV